MGLVRVCLTLFTFVVCCLSCTSTDDLVTEEDIVFLPSDRVLLKPSLKVLDIGNSYTNDATAYLPYLIEKLGVALDDMCLYKATLGGASFKHWYNVYHDLNNSTYEVSRVIGGLDANVVEGKGDVSDGSLFRNLLSEEIWDVIIVHPLGRYATNYDAWWQQSEAGYLKELLDIIMGHQQNCFIGFLLVHSPDDEYSTNEEHSSLARWEKTALATQRFVQECKINILIPYGTAIQNLRATELNNELELTRDGAHLGNGLARYTAACCYYEALLAHRTGVSILEKDIPYVVPEVPEKSQYSVTNSNMITAQKAAVLAYMNPYICSNPNVFEIESLNY